MCIALWYVNQTGKYRFVLLFNREEFSQRPTKELSIVNDNIICGLDTLGGGTWLGVNLSNGAIAFLTNRSIVNSKTYCHYIQQSIDMIRMKTPLSWLYPKLQSRGDLIIQILKGGQKQDAKLEQQSINITVPKSEVDVDSMLMRALLNKSKYRAFNLFVGSITELKFKTTCSVTSKVQNVEKQGSLYSMNNADSTPLVKQSLAQEQFMKIINESDNLIEDLFTFAQCSIKSTEEFFKKCPNEATFFIPEYTTKLGKRGTRTTTLVIYDGTNIEVHEKTYI